MPHGLSLYTKLTRVQEEPEPSEELKKADDIAANRQIVNNWRQSTVTREEVLKLEKSIIGLFNDCVRLSVTFPQDTAKILSNLNQIHATKQILDRYAI